MSYTKLFNTPAVTMRQALKVRRVRIPFPNPATRASHFTRTITIDICTYVTQKQWGHHTTTFLIMVTSMIQIQTITKPTVARSSAGGTMRASLTLVWT